MDNAVIGENAVLNGGSLVDSHVQVKDDAEIPANSICSLRSYDIEKKAFKTAKDLDSNEMLDKGVISFIPREMVLKEYETLGCTANNDADVDSDLDFGYQEEEEDPEKQFIDECTEIFNETVKQQAAQ